MHHWSFQNLFIIQHISLIFTYIVLELPFKSHPPLLRDIQKQSFRSILKALEHWNTWMQSAWWWAWLPESYNPRAFSPILLGVHTCSIWLLSEVFQPHLCTMQGRLVLLLADGSWPLPCVVQMGTEYPQQWLKLEQFYWEHRRIMLRNSYRNDV